VVREEVRIGKKEVTNVESFDEQLRSEELKVDPNGQQVVDKTA
jgi:stress response protein YsnF